MTTASHPPDTQLSEELWSNFSTTSLPVLGRPNSSSPKSFLFKDEETPVPQPLFVCPAPLSSLVASPGLAPVYQYLSYTGEPHTEHMIAE